MSASREKKKRQTVTDADMTQAHAGQKGMSKTTKTALSIVAAILVVAIIVFFALVSRISSRKWIRIILYPARRS